MAKPTQTEILLGLVNQEAYLFHTEKDEGFAWIKVGEHFESWPIRSTGFRKWLCQRFFEASGKAPASEAMSNTLMTAEGIAQFGRCKHPVFVRLGEHDGNIFLDLGNEDWEAVKITPKGWKVLNKLPVYFRRAKGLLSLPQPEKGGGLEDLRPFLNIQSESTWRLAVAWLVQAARPTGPYPVLVLQGEQGSAKSTFARLLRAIVDPSLAPLRTTPRSERDLVISANNSWVLAFDNVSRLPDWLSDGICRMATGGGLATRELYTNEEETLFSATRPVILNGIDDMVSRHDLADRAIHLALSPIPDEERISEKQLMTRFNTALPKILGGLCDAISEALTNIESTHLDSMPRMADFSLWVTAAEPALGWPCGGFLDVYQENRSHIVESALEFDLVANTLRGWFEDKSHWEGTASAFKEDLETYADKKTIQSKAWPGSSRTFSSRLRRAASFLRVSGIVLTFHDKARPRIIEVARKEAHFCDGSDGSDGDEENQGVSADATPTQPDATLPFCVGEKAERKQQHDATDATDARKHLSSGVKGITV
jgi:hypothetical protein